MRMRVVDESCHLAALVHLGFEDFLEAIVRLCTMKARPPTTKSTRRAPRTPASSCSAQKDPKAWDHFLIENEQTWDVEPPQPIALRRLMTLLVRVVSSTRRAPTSTAPPRPARCASSGSAAASTARRAHPREDLRGAGPRGDTHRSRRRASPGPHHAPPRAPADDPPRPRRAPPTHHHAHKEPAAEPSAQMTRRHGSAARGHDEATAAVVEGGRYG